MAYKKQKGGPKMYRKDGALPMKSPMKNINNMKAYSKPGDAVQFGDGIKMHDGEEHDGLKMYGSPNEMEKAPTYMKSPNEMKSSGFKMKSGSPFQRNFGIGASPVKATKPDYPDIDGDGNTTESMKQAAADKKGPLEMASPMKRAEIELDGEVVSAADYKKYKKKDRELDEARFDGGNVGSKTYKEHFGDDFMTKNEWTVSQNPGAYIEDGSVYIKNPGGTHMEISKDHSGYSDYMSTFDDKYEGDKQAEYEGHRGGDSESTLEGSGMTGAANINLTGSDFINDLKLQHQNYYANELKKGEPIPSFQSWMKDMGGETENTYKEALAFEEFKAEKGLSGKEALTAWRNRENLTDQ